MEPGDVPVTERSDWTCWDLKQIFPLNQKLKMILQTVCVSLLGLDRGTSLLDTMAQIVTILFLPTSVRGVHCFTTLVLAWKVAYFIMSNSSI